MNHDMLIAITNLELINEMSQEDLDFERTLNAIKNYREIRALDSENLFKNDLAGLLSTEDISEYKIVQGTENLKGLFSKSLLYAETFYGKLRNLVLSKTSTEKYISSRFGHLLKTIEEHETSRAFVKAPTFQEIIRRLNGLILTVNFLKAVGEKDPSDSIFANDIYYKIEATSAGVFKVVSPKEESSFKNLAFVPAPYVEYEIKASQWAKESEVNKIENLVLRCKYDLTEEIAKITKNIKEHYKKYISASGNFNLDNTEVNSEEYQKILDMYNAMYLLLKMCKAVHLGIEKEVNAISVNYLHALMNMKDK